MGKSDANDGGGYHPRSAAASLNVVQPAPYTQDPKYLEAKQEKKSARKIMTSCKAKIGTLLTKIARQPRVFWRFIGIGFCVLVDTLAIGGSFHDIGKPSPDCYVYGWGLSAFLITMICVATQTKNKTLRYAVIGGSVLLGIALCIVRIVNAPPTGAPMIGLLAEGLMMLGAIAGSPICAEFWFAPLRGLLIDLKELWSLEKQLRAAKKDYTRAMAYITRKANDLASFWQEYRILRAAYARGYRKGRGVVPPNADLDDDAAIAALHDDDTDEDTFPPTVTEFIAEPASISSGDSATLRWSVSLASSVTIEPGLGALAPEDSSQVRPTKTTTYRLSASGPDGVTTAAVTVTVAAEPPLLAARATNGLPSWPNS